MVFTEDANLIYDFLWSQGYEVESVTKVTEEDNKVIVNFNTHGFGRVEKLEVSLFDIMSFVYSRLKNEK